MKYPLTLDTWTTKETQAVLSVIRSRQFTASKKTILFEKAIARKFSSRFAIMTSSGSMANLLAVSALRYREMKPLSPGDEIIVPAVAWSTTYAPLLQNGYKLKIVDINLNTLNIDLPQLQKAISNKTKAILAVNILGNPAPLEEIKRICDKKKILLLEDNCESMGAKIGNKYTGTFGEISTFSTFYSHHIHTIEGGIILTQDPELADIVTCLRTHGWARDLHPEGKLMRSSEKKVDFPEAYNFILPGYNGRSTELNAAVGLVQLKKMDAFLRIRRKNAKYFRKIFKNDGRFILQEENGLSSWFAFTILLHPNLPIDRNTVLNELRRKKIQFRLVTGGNFLQHPMKKYYNYTISESLKNADIVHHRGFFVGNYAKDLSAEIKFLHKTLTNSLV